MECQLTNVDGFRLRKIAILQPSAWIIQMAHRWRICLPMQETQETWVRFLSWEDPLEEEMATHSCILVWKIPWTEEPGGLQSMASQGVGWNWATEHTHTQSHISYSKMDVKMAWWKFNEERIIYFVLKYLPTDDLSHSKGQTGKKVKSTSPNMETKWHYMPSIPHVPSKI